MPTIASIVCEELNDSGQLTFSPDGLRGKRIFKTEWDDCITLARALLETEWESFPGLIRRRVAKYPWVLPDGTELSCNTVDIDSMGKSSGDPGNIEYDYAKVTATYKPIHFSSSDVDPDTLGDANVDYGAEFLASPKNTWKYDDTGYEIDENVGILLCFTEITVNLYGLEELPWSGLRNCRGRINDEEWNDADKGTVLFLGASSRRSWSVEGFSAYDLSLKFKEKEKDWNYVLGKDGDWHLIVDIKDGTKNPYTYADFSTVLDW